MKLAVLGSGMIVADFLPAAASVPGLELVAICGRPESRHKLDDLQQRFGIGRVFTDLDETLADPGIDTVWVAVPNSLHFEYAERALRAGKHVICEKPFVLEEAQLTQLRMLATERELILVEAITTVDQPNYRWIRDHLDLVGDLKVVQCDFSQYSSRYDAFRSGAVPPAFDPAQGGGALLDIGIYTIHFVVGLFGAPEHVAYVPNIDRGVDTSGVLTLDYGDFAAVCVCAKDSDGPMRTKLQGTDGTIVVDGAPNVMPSVIATRRGAGDERVDLREHGHRMVDEFVAFERMIAALDIEERDRRLDHSAAVLSVATRARASAGLR